LWWRGSGAILCWVPTNEVTEKEFYPNGAGGKRENPKKKKKDYLKSVAV